MFEENSNTGGLGKRTTDPNEKKTWDVAKKLGVAQELNLASEDVRRDFANGVKNAANVVKFKNLDTDHPDVLKYTEALIKKSLAEPIQDETPWVKAMEDAKTALSNSKAKVYQSPSLVSYLKLRQSENKSINVAKHFFERQVASKDTEDLIDGDIVLAKDANIFDSKSLNPKIDSEEDAKIARQQMETMLYEQGTVYKGSHNKFSERAFHAVIQNNKLISTYSNKYNIPQEVIASIILEEQYVKWVPDTAVVILTAMGGDKHSTGLGAIQPGTAAAAWDALSEETGIDYSNNLPKTEAGWSYQLAYNNELNIQTICLVLAMEAKRINMVDSYDDLSSLTYEQWKSILYTYNGSGPNAEKYSERVGKLLPKMKMFMDDITLRNGQSNSW